MLEMNILHLSIMTVINKNGLQSSREVKMEESEKGPLPITVFAATANL